MSLKIWRCSALRLATTMLRTGFQTIVLPLAILYFSDSADKGKTLALISCSIVILALPIYLLSSYLGDILKKWCAINHILMCVGCLLIFIGLLNLGQIHDLSSLFFIGLIAMLGISIAEAANLGLISDFSSKFDSHKLSSCFSYFTFLGLILGPLLSSLLIDPSIQQVIQHYIGINVTNNTYYLMSIVFIIIFIIALLSNTINMKTDSQSAPTILSEPQHPSTTKFDKTVYTLFLLARSLIIIVALSLYALTLFIIDDLFSSQQVVMSAALALILSQCGALIGVLVTQRLTYCRTHILSALMSICLLMIMALMLMIFSFFTVLSPVFYVGIFLFGLGYGGFFSLSMVYCLTILGKHRLSGFLLTLNNSSSFIAFLIGLFISGIILDLFSAISFCFSYTVILMIFIGFVMLTFLLCYKIKRRVLTI